MAHRKSAKGTPRNKNPVWKNLLPPSSPPAENEEEDQEKHHESPLPLSPPPPSTEKRKLRKNKMKENENEKGKEIEETEDRALAWRMNWTAEDETGILKGMAAFKASTGHDPYKQAEAFRDFMKESEYSVSESSVVQLKDKIRTMKRKFCQGLGVQQFKELARKVWEPEKNTACEEAEEEQEQERRCNNTKRKRVRVAGVKGEPDDNDDNSKNIIGNWSEVLPGVSEEVLNKAFNSIEGSEKAEWVTRWKKHQIAEFELCVNKTELIRDLARLLWGAYKSLNN